MKHKVVVEYEYPVEHKTPVKAELILHGDSVETWDVKPLEQESKWIPVDKKRPIGFEKVLVTYRLHRDESIHVGFGGIKCNLFNDRYYWDINEQVIGWDVLAWMPLPKPYEGG